MSKCHIVGNLMHWLISYTQYVMLQQDISDGAADDFLSTSTAALERGFSAMNLIAPHLEAP